VAAGAVRPLARRQGLPSGPALDKRGSGALVAPKGEHRHIDPGRSNEDSRMDRAETDSRIRTLIEPFNKKGADIADGTTFAGDLEFDSLTVMDFVAAIEDEFDIIISMNQQAEIETYGQLVDAVCKLAGD
jgi:acyl carrier protein